MNNVSNLITVVKRIQSDKGLSDGQFAKLLNIDRSTWSLIKRYLRPPGAKILKAIAREIPEAQLLVFQYIAQDTDNGNTGDDKEFGEEAS